VKWPKNDEGWERFSAFLAVLLEESRYDLRKIASEAGCFDLSDLEKFQREMGTILCVEPVEVALYRHGPADDNLKKRIQHQIEDYEL
jgi:hypothetical protein